MNKHHAVGVRDIATGEVTICAEASVAGYHTLCGNSLDDSELEEADIPNNARVNCKRCKELWEDAIKLTKRDFA